MAQSKFFIVFACLALVSVSHVNADEAKDPQAPPPQSSEQSSGEPSVTEDDLNAFKAEIDKEISEKKITCENYDEICQKLEEELGVQQNEDKNKSICRIIMKTYLCEGSQNIDTIKRISEKLVKLSEDYLHENASKSAKESDTR